MPDVGSPEGYDFHEEIDEYEATALNVLMDLGEGETEDDKSIGEAIQLQLAAFVAFGRVKGKGKGKQKGQRKSHQVQPSVTRRSRPSRSVCVVVLMGIGQVTLFANSLVPKDMLVGKTPHPHQVPSQQCILQTFRTHLQTMESS